MFQRTLEWDCETEQDYRENLRKVVQCLVKAGLRLSKTSTVVRVANERCEVGESTRRKVRRSKGGATIGRVLVNYDPINCFHNLSNGLVNISSVNMTQSTRRSRHHQPEDTYTINQKIKTQSTRRSRYHQPEDPDTINQKIKTKPTKFIHVMLDWKTYSLVFEATTQLFFQTASVGYLWRNAFTSKARRWYMVPSTSVIWRAMHGGSPRPVVDCKTSWSHSQYSVTQPMYLSFAPTVYTNNP